MRWLLFLILFISCDYMPDEPGAHDYEGTVPVRAEVLMDAVLKEYAPEAKVYVLYDQPLAYGIIGLANQVAPHTYLIQISAHSPNVQSTIFHELGHIIDSEQGRLKFKTPMRWRNITCDWTIPWHERPWEISANEWRDCLHYEYENGQLKHYPYFLFKPLR